VWVWGAVLPALLAGLATALWVSSPLEQVARVADRRSGTDRRSATDRRSGPDDRSPGLVGTAGVRPWRSRPDSASLRRRILLASVAAVAVGLAVRPALGSVAWLLWLAVPVLAVGGVVVLGRLEPRASRERGQRLVLELPQALDLLSACLAAGMPLRRATSAVAVTFEGPVGEDLSDVLGRIDLGVSDVEAWRTLRGHPQWGAAAVDLARSAESGTMMVEVLAHHARDARARRRAALEVRAKSVGVRSVLPLMTCFLPAFMLVGVVPTVASAVRHALF
jgi:Flp pilus assembly protein TadB